MNHEDARSSQERPSGPLFDTGVIHGRFQVLHNDHLTYLLAGKRRCRHLVVGITNPDPLLTRDETADAHRSLPLANPLTYYERYRLIRAVLEEAGAPWPEFSIVPLPINLPRLFQYYVPLDAVFFLTIYDEWGRRKRDRFHSLGMKTWVLWERNSSEKGVSGAEVRRRMMEDLPWEHLTPRAAEALLKQWDIPLRLKTMAAEEARVLSGGSSGDPAP